MPTARTVQRGLVLLKPTSDIIAEVEHHLLAGHFRDAAGICARELAGSPGDIPLLALLTSACEHAGEVCKAREAAVQWVQTAPLDSYAHYRLAMIEQRLGNYGAAAERLDIAAHVAEPDDEVAFAAREAQRALDDLQLRQVAALVETDLCFRLKLHTDPDAALAERGFTLSAQVLRHLLQAEGAVLAAPPGHPPMPS